MNNAVLTILNDLQYVSIIDVMHMYKVSKSLRMHMRIWNINIIHTLQIMKCMCLWRDYIKSIKLRKRQNSWSKTLHTEDEMLIPPDMLLFKP